MREEQTISNQAARLLEEEAGARMYVADDGGIIFSPAVRALKWTTIFANASNDYYKRAAELMKAAEAQERGVSGG